MMFLNLKLTILSKSAKKDGAVASFRVHVFTIEKKSKNCQSGPTNTRFFSIHRRRILENIKIWDIKRQEVKVRNTRHYKEKSF